MTGTDLFLVGEIPISSKKYLKPGGTPLVGVVADSQIFPFIVDGVRTPIAPTRVTKRLRNSALSVVMFSPSPVYHR
jgi:hypothetical protein